MSDANLGRAVLEIGIEDAKYKEGIKSADQQARTFVTSLTDLSNKVSGTSSVMAASAAGFTVNADAARAAYTANTALAASSAALKSSQTSNWLSKPGCTANRISDSVY